MYCTEQDVDEPSQVGPLLGQIPADAEIDQVTADGAHDGEPTYQTILARQSDIAVVIPPRQGAVLSQADGAIVMQRDAHVLMMESLGRLGWQEANHTPPLHQRQANRAGPKGKA